MKKPLLWVTGAACAVILAAGLGSAIFEKSAQAQAAGVPHFVWDPRFVQDLPNRCTTWQVGETCVDDQDHTWIAHRPATVAPGERSASLYPPAARCCTPAPPINEFD